MVASFKFFSSNTDSWRLLKMVHKAGGCPFLGSEALSAGVCVRRPGFLEALRLMLGASCRGSR